MDAVLSWYEYSMREELSVTYCPEDIRDLFDGCVWDIVKKCERVLLGPIVCPRTYNMSDEYAQHIHVMHVVEWMLDEVKVARHDNLCKYIEWIMRQADRKYEMYVEYQHDVLLNPEDDYRFHSLDDVDPTMWTDAYKTEYQRLWRKMHGNFPCCPEIARRLRIAITECRNGATQARADFAARFPQSRA